MLQKGLVSTAEEMMYCEAVRLSVRLSCLGAALCSLSALVNS